MFLVSLNIKRKQVQTNLSVTSALSFHCLRSRVTESLVKVLCPLNGVKTHCSKWCLDSAKTYLSDTRFSIFLWPLPHTFGWTHSLGIIIYSFFIAQSCWPDSCLVSKQICTVSSDHYILIVWFSTQVNLLFPVFASSKGTEHCILKNWQHCSIKHMSFCESHTFFLVLPIWPGTNYFFLRLDRNNDFPGGLIKIETVKWTICMISVLEFCKERVIFENCLGWNKLQKWLLIFFWLITAGSLDMLFLKSAVRS